MRTPRRRVAGAGFTLIEIMIVVVIMLAIAAFVTVNLMSSKDKATTNLVKVQLGSLRDAIKQFQMDFDRYPTQEEGLAVLWNKESLNPDADASNWRPYMDQPLPNDKWNTPWGYRAEGENSPEGMFDLWSNGPDKQEGTDDDIWLWQRTDESGGTESGPPPASGTTPPG